MKEKCSSLPLVVEEMEAIDLSCLAATINYETSERKHK